MSIVDNLNAVRERICSAATRAGTDPADVTLIAVTKTVDISRINEAINAGITDVGENYIQNAAGKFEAIGSIVKWHMIGHLQTNKVKQAVHIFDLIQSVDSIRLADEIAKRSVAIGKTTKILVEVNISGEESKTGTSPDELPALLDGIAGMKGIELSGLMGIAPFVDDPKAIRSSFRLLKRLWDDLPSESRRWLSMGMTSDFETAIEEGSNMVRIGTAIFGPR